MATNGMLPEDISLQALRTIQTDTQDSVLKDNVTKASILAEQEKQHAAQRAILLAEAEAQASANTSSQSSGSSSFPKVLKGVFFTLIATVVVAGAGYGVLRIASERNNEPPIQVNREPLQNQLVVYNHALSLFIDSEMLSSREKLNVKLGEARVVADGVTLYQTNTPLKYLFPVLSPTVPAEFVRTLEEKDFFGGTTQGNFFILKTDSYEQAYAGMLEWEGAIKNDVNAFFLLSSDKELAKFEDRIVSNRDIRAAIGTKGEILFVYGFYEEDTIIFAATPELFRDVYDMLYRPNL